MRILVVERDKEYRSFIQKGLSREGFAVDVAADAGQALELTARIPYEALLLNGDFPDRTAYGLMDALRHQPCHAVILVFSDHQPERGVSHGARPARDHQLMRPTIANMAARLYEALDPSPAQEGDARNHSVLACGQLRMDLGARRVEWRGKEIVLTKKEFELLECLMRHPGIVLSQHVIAQELWNVDFQSHSNVVETHVKRLRAKLGDRSPAHLIETIRGVGYRLTA